MLFVKFIRKVQFVASSALWWWSPWFASSLLVEARDTEGSTLAILVVVAKWVSHSLARLFYINVKGSRLRLSRVECFRIKKEREEKRKKRGGKDENFCSTMVREQAETGGSMKHPRCTFIGSHEQIYSCDAIPGYSRA